MTNPLIAKYEEIYGKKEEPKKEEPKKEEPKKVEPPEFWKESPFAYDPTTSVNTPTTINPNSVGAITAANHIPPPFKTLTSYDTHSVDDSFFQIAEKIQKGDAKVVSMSVNMENFTKSCTFEVQVSN